ncbi:hypothetical protein PV08_03890 [Exophiala spinifera]|uniref:Aminoglycoside phosphotransferase domain-containing protein n=1 Tax=Exophiala spinifera TaxID=91928 RepID=A0A0D1ZVF3_9EURO|nr:uncharacterized protein PV08_03890 [Exophiala spinifera]KIW16702.1 hypothetical protein PV08_03890 [Exophiala spinifera]
MESTPCNVPPKISLGSLPDHTRPVMDFNDSSFFKIRGQKLPEPPKVNTRRNGIVTFPELKLVIKYGPFTTVDEAVTMWAVKKHLGHTVPVPELYGWRVRQGTVFIYMELIPGTTLRDCWNDLAFSDKEAICLHERNTDGCCQTGM